jgi:integrase
MSVRKREWTTSTGETKSAWIVAYTDQDGQRHIETFKRKKEADAWAQQTGVDVRAGTHTPASKSPTVAQAADAWIDRIAGKDREQSTLAQYRQHAKHISSRIGHHRLGNLTAPGINTFYDELVTGDKKVSRAMARKLLVSLKSILRDAQRRGTVAQNVALSVKADVDKRSHHRLVVGVDIPTPSDIKLIIAALSGHPGGLRPLLLTAIFTGLRASELRGLRWLDVDFKRPVVHVKQRADRYNAIGKPKSKAGDRTIPIGPDLVNILRAWKLACPKGEAGLVFPTRKGRIEHHSNMVRAFKQAVLAAGLTVPVVDQHGKPKRDADGVPIMAAKYTGLHSLRHFYASWCINRKADGGLELPVKIVQTRLGHATVAMTMDRYGHLFPSQDDGSELVGAERALLG